MTRMKTFLQRAAAGYSQFVEKQGFTLILGVCVAIIVSTALWTRHVPHVVPEPTPPMEASQSAAELLQQSLADVATPSPAPTQPPQTYSPPLATVRVITPFDNARMHPSGVTGLWRLHDAIDLGGKLGEPVLSMSEGVVAEVREGGVEGACIVIAHAPTLLADYAGMAALAGLRVGDPVEKGQTLGFLGNGMIDETDLEAHLHLRVTRDEHAIDPTLLWK